MIRLDLPRIPDELGMDLLVIAADGFAAINVDQVYKDRALVFLGQWLRQPEFQAYRPQLEWLVQEKQWSGLLDRFYQILPFGTGGRRGAVGIGPNRMNPWTLTASVQGHCEYLKERFPGDESLTVVLAYDVRRFEDVRQQYNPNLPNPVLGLTSRDLARHAACVYAANGIVSRLLPADASRYLSTPELSFAIRYYQAHGGLNISASHNPPDDNGGKFYDERGGQPVPPDDQIMADLVDQVSTIRSLPWPEVARSAMLAPLDEAAHQGYLDLLARGSLLGSVKPGECTVVYTPLHGVGGGTVMQLLERQRFEVVPVPDQMEPNGLFPHVTSPNPEVPASMDGAVAVAQQHQSIDLILSSDPDADRIGAMTRLSLSPPAGEGRGGGAGESKSGWRYLNGNEIAALLTHFKLAQLARHGLLPPSPIVIKTEVTTGLVTRIARRFNCQVVENLLVGFKYVAEVLRQLETQGRYEDVHGRPEDLIIACEESHGIQTTPHLRDKDAAGGALLLAELALYQQRRGLTVGDYLQHLYRQFGCFHNTLQTITMSGILGKKQLLAMMASMRATPPKTIGALQVTTFEDLEDERGRLGPLKGATDAASRNVLLFRCGERARLALRPSGTEPKAKVYLEVCTPPCPANLPAEQWIQECREAAALGERLGKDFVQQALDRVGGKHG